jgi:hypothetical protein
MMEISLSRVWNNIDAKLFADEMRKAWDDQCAGLNTHKKEGQSKAQAELHDALKQSEKRLASALRKAWDSPGRYQTERQALMMNELLRVVKEAETRLRIRLIDHATEIAAAF